MGDSLGGLQSLAAILSCRGSASSTSTTGAIPARTSLGVVAEADGIRNGLFPFARGCIARRSSITTSAGSNGLRARFPASGAGGG